MPFQSEKQRKYLHANHPEIAKRWERDYAGGGRIGFDTGTPKDFQKFLNERKEAIREEDLDRLMEQYKQWYKRNYPQFEEAAHGGRIGFAEGHATGGISNLFKLKEGGNIRLQPHTASDLLVQKTLSGERPKYQPPGGGETSMGSGAATSGGSSSSSSSSSSGDAGHLSHNVSVSQGGTKPDTKTTTTTGNGHRNIHQDTGKEEEAYVMVGGKKVHQPKWGTKDDPREQIEYTGSEDLEEILEIDLENARRKLKYDPNLTKDERENLEVGLGLRKAKSKSGFWGMVGKGILTLATAGAGAGLFGKDIMKVASLYNKYKKGKNIYNTLKKGELDLGFTKVNLNKVTNKLKSSDQKLMESLPKGHPERIALEAQMKVRTPPKHDGEGGTETSIKIEDIETVNDANAEQVQLKKYREMELASYRAMIQQQEDRSKQMAYWKQMMAPYMAAQGGRVPGGYNTGGLSNLFRLKNV